jgi:hypothetical protein
MIPEGDGGRLMEGWRRAANNTTEPVDARAGSEDATTLDSTSSRLSVNTFEKQLN